MLLLWISHTSNIRLLGRAIELGWMKKPRQERQKERSGLSNTIAQTALSMAQRIAQRKNAETMISHAASLKNIQLDDTRRVKMENRYILRHTVNGRDYDQDFSTRELAEDAGDKLWNSYLKEDQDRLQALYMFDRDTRKLLKVWKKLTVG